MGVISSFENLSSNEKTELQKWMLLGTFGTTQQKEEARVWFNQHYTVLANGELWRRENYDNPTQEWRLRPPPR